MVTVMDIGGIHFSWQGKGRVSVCRRLDQNFSLCGHPSLLLPQTGQMEPNSGLCSLRRKFMLTSSSHCYTFIQLTQNKHSRRSSLVWWVLYSKRKRTYSAHKVLKGPRTPTSTKGLIGRAASVKDGTQEIMKARKTADYTKEVLRLFFAKKKKKKQTTPCILHLLVQLPQQRKRAAISDIVTNRKLIVYYVGRHV